MKPALAALESSDRSPDRSAPQSLRSQFAAKAGDFLPLCDSVALLLTGYFSLFSYAAFIASAAVRPETWAGLHRLVWIAAAVAPFVLYERNFAPAAGAAERGQLVRGFGGRLLVLLGVVGVIAYAGRWLEDAPTGWLALWLGSAALLVAGSRALLARYLRRLALHDNASAPPAPARDSAVESPPVVAYVGDWLRVTLLADRPIKQWNAVFKTSKDFVLASTITLLLLPLLGCIALAIRLESPGPILFKQRRHGFNNREFDIYKFRTMRIAPAGPVTTTLQQTVRGDARITRIGHFLRKWSLDELPQVFNVLEGDMSLVGPRPHAVNMRTEERLGEEITDAYLHRHRVKPGITGWAQVNGSRGATDTAEQLRRRVELDLYYVDNWSTLFDLLILTRTLKVVLRPVNAF